MTASPPTPGGATALPESSLVELSVVIPAYNEEQRLARCIAEVGPYLDAFAGTVEVLVVENGSTDRTPRLADELAAKDPRVRAMHLPERGKGLASRQGVLASVGRIVVLCDVDFSMPVEQATRLIRSIADGADIAIASREAPGSQRIGEPLHRHLIGRVFNWLVQRLALPGLNDSQCGFKAFRRPVARDLFEKQTVNGWAFDIEVLYIARRRGYTIREVPITWRYAASSRVVLVRDTIGMLRELLMIRWNAMRGRYG